MRKNFKVLLLSLLVLFLVSFATSFVIAEEITIGEEETSVENIEQQAENISPNVETIATVKEDETDFIVSSEIMPLADVSSVTVSDGGKLLLSGANKYEVYAAGSIVADEVGVLADTAVIGSETSDYMIEFAEGADIRVASIIGRQIDMKGAANARLSVNGVAYGISAKALSISDLYVEATAEGRAIYVNCQPSDKADYGHLSISNSTVDAAAVTAIQAYRGISIVNNSNVTATTKANTNGLIYGRKSAAHVNQIGGQLTISDSSFTAKTTQAANASTEGLAIYGDIQIKNSNLVLGDADDLFSYGIYHQNYTMNIVGSNLSVHAKTAAAMVKEMTLSNSDINVYSSGIGIQSSTASPKIIISNSNLQIEAGTNGLAVNGSATTAADTILDITDSNIDIKSKSAFAVYINKGSAQITDSTLNLSSKTIANQAVLYVGGGNAYLKQADITAKTNESTGGSDVGFWVNGSVIMDDSTLAARGNRGGVIVAQLEMEGSELSASGGVIAVTVNRASYIDIDSKVSASINEYGASAPVAIYRFYDEMEVAGELYGISTYGNMNGILTDGQLNIYGLVEISGVSHSTASGNEHVAVMGDWQLKTTSAILIENYSMDLVLDSQGKNMDEDHPQLNDFTQYSWSITSGEGSVAIDRDTVLLYAETENTNKSTLTGQANNHTINYLNTSLSATKYKVTFDYNYPEAMLPVTEVEVAYRSAIIKPDTINRPGYMLVAWHDEAGNIWYFQGEDNARLMPNKDITLYAQWEAEQLPEAGNNLGENNDDNSSNNNTNKPTVKPASPINTGVDVSWDLLVYAGLFVGGVVITITGLRKKQH